MTDEEDNDLAARHMRIWLWAAQLVEDYKFLKKECQDQDSEE